MVYKYNIFSDRPQSLREEALNSIATEPESCVLVATDVLARGHNIKNLTFVSAFFYSRALTFFIWVEIDLGRQLWYARHDRQVYSSSRSSWTQREWGLRDFAFRFVLWRCPSRPRHQNGICFSVADFVIEFGLNWFEKLEYKCPGVEVPTPRSTF